MLRRAQAVRGPAPPSTSSRKPQHPCCPPWRWGSLCRSQRSGGRSPLPPVGTPRGFLRLVGWCRCRPTGPGRWMPAHGVLLHHLIWSDAYRNLDQAA